MALPKKYLHDRLVLLLLSVQTFFALLGTTLILLRLGSGQRGVYWAEYRSNLGIGAHIPGKLTDLLAFVLFFVIVLGVNTMLSAKAYVHHRNYALTVLGLGILLMILSIIVSNLLLDLR
ncbi:MAG: hypothetical protein WCO19_00585 [Candidatus Saccharibacteria bacterium]|nr:hypothetical protein [Candidatus Saccharibacteria bacterium]